jgi:hypothetical protein
MSKMTATYLEKLNTEEICTNTRKILQINKKYPANNLQDIFSKLLPMEKK